MLKLSKKIYLILAIVGAFFTITSCTRLVSIQIDLEQTNYEVRLGQSLEIVPVVTENNNPSDAPIAYYSYDNSIASFVDTKLVAHNIGQVRIKVYSVDNPNIYDVAIVNVIKDNSLEVEFDYEEIMLKGEKQTIDYKLLIDDGRKLTFTTNHPEVVQIDEDGNLVAIGVGDALITTRIDSLYDEGVYKEYSLAITVIYEKYHITYELDGGVNHIDNLDEYIVDDLPISLGIPSRDGYVFEGWYLNGEKVTSIAEGTKGDLHFVAKWELADYTIHYELDGGINHPDNKNGYTIDNLPLTLYQPTKKGYNFTGWYLNNQLVEYLPENTLGEITLVATWELATYNLFYNLDGGILESENPTTYTMNDEFILNNPTKNGYNFLGWYVNDVKIEKIEKGTTGNLTLLAKWELQKHTIEFNSNGGTNVSNQIVNHFDKVLEPDHPTRLGYDFLGWFIGEDEYDFNNEVTTNLELVAKWQIINYNINYDLNDSINNSSNPSSYTVEDTISLLNPTKKGYIFVGWYVNDNKVEQINLGTTGHLTLVAKWRTYQISEIKEENKGTVVATTGIVTAISTNNNGFSILIQDATDAIMVYKIDDSQFNYNEFYVGQEVTILAEYTLFNGLSELQNIEKIELGEIKEIPSVVELDTLPDEEILKAMQSKIIKIKLTYLSGEIASKSNANFIDSLGNQIVVRGDSTWGNIDTISLKENQEVIVTGFINWYNGAQITNVGNHQFIEQKDEDLANAILDSLNVPASISQTTDLDKIDGLTWELVTANSNVKVENNQIIVLSNDEETTITILAKYLYKNVEYTKSFDIVVEQATPPLFNNGDKVIIFTKRSSGNYFIMNSDLGTANTKRFQAIDTGTSILNDVTNQAENQVWTIETSGDNYYLKSFDGKYITWSSGNSSNLSDEKYALNITYDGEFYQILSVSDSTRKLQLNNTSGNNYFAFYTGNQAGNLVIQKAQELTDEEKIDIFLNNLEVETSVSDDFSLPESEGLTWSLKDGTSDYAILGDAVVTITRPAIGESDVIVCFVASYTLNGITKTKEFNITIKALEDVTEQQIFADFSDKKYSKAEDVESKFKDPITVSATLVSATANNGDMNGIKLGTGSKVGSILLSFNLNNVKITKIIINVSPWHSSGNSTGKITAANVKVTNNASTSFITNETITNDNTELVIENFDGNTLLVETISKGYRLFINSITIEYENI
ncbi:MAG: hypothetical protein HPY96_01920 [Bacilli bacterium]|nr:hypothetical protein [Bacilli bacterium]